MVFFPFPSTPYHSLFCHSLLQCKVDLLKNKFGFDDAFNYKEEPDLDAALKRLVAMLTEIEIC